jgi:hypothetical protein
MFIVVCYIVFVFLGGYVIVNFCLYCVCSSYNSTTLIKFVPLCSSKFLVRILSLL